MKKKILQTGAVPTAIGPYSQAVWVDHLLFCSGQIGTIPGTGAMVDGGIREQTTRVLDNIVALLKSQDLTLSHVIKTTVFLADMGQFGEMNEIYARYFASDYPARSTVQVARLPKNALVEIEIIAARPG